MSKGQYENQLRRKLTDAESQYRDLGSVRIQENTARLLPVVQRELKQAKLRLDDSKRRKKDGETVDLTVQKKQVEILTGRVSAMRKIMTPPKRITKSTSVYYATTATRILDFDGSDHGARQFGGTIVSMNSRIEVDDPAMADRDLNDAPKREWLRSDVTDEVRHLQARLQWLRDRIARVNTHGSTEQWLLSQPFRPTR